ncbi:FtsH protease activity modulator HflK [Tsuneonella mangrovi]|uniref:FtsH protease activity modulator HflK n=1 Tax=Tsuneonella mangrovi TaxID=1982042 RepID=UPI001F0A75E5|nr:FtsH protease activity modulator HflK [Tsuneonella mangrovi]
MKITDGLGHISNWAAHGLAMAGKGNPWGGTSGGSGDGSDDGNDSGDDSGDGTDGETPADKPRGPRNPWLPGGGEPRRSAGIEDIFRHRGPEGPRRGGGGPGFRLPDAPGGRSWFPLAVLAIIAVWLGFSMFHQVGPKEEGIVTTFGKYSRTLQSGLNFTAPWPFQEVYVQNVSEIRIDNIPEGTGQKLMLTGDQNLVDLSYIVRWNIKNLAQYRFQLDDPAQTVRETAEAAMRASVGERKLNDVVSGAGRADIEQAVKTRMQDILNSYRAGVTIQGVEIRKTDPPKEVEDAFKNVTAAQQTAESYVNQAEATAQQVLARAQGDAVAFDKVYAQYKLAPEVTRRRMYYETMERVLRETDKTIVAAPNVTTYLPLPEMQRGAKQQASTPPASGDQQAGGQ